MGRREGLLADPWTRRWCRAEFGPLDVVREDGVRTDHNPERAEGNQEVIHEPLLFLCHVGRFAVRRRTRE